jgi:hypothetical protein
LYLVKNPLKKNVIPARLVPDLIRERESIFIHSLLSGGRAGFLPAPVCVQRTGRQG